MSGPGGKARIRKSEHFADFKAGLCGQSVCNQGEQRDNPRHCGFVHTESTTPASSTGRRTDCAVGLEPVSSEKKKPHPTIARGAGRLHRPSFLDARTQTRREVVLGLSLSASVRRDISLAKFTQTGEPTDARRLQKGDRTCCDCLSRWLQL